MLYLISYPTKKIMVAMVMMIMVGDNNAMYVLFTTTHLESYVCGTILYGDKTTEELKSERMKFDK